MKKILLIITCLTFILMGTTGCVKSDSMEDIQIITSSYPIEYLVSSIYGQHATIENVFPDGENIDVYKFNDKEYTNFSKYDLFVYNGKNSSDIAVELLNRNNNILLIDSTLGMKYTYGIEETWIDPSNLLMMAKNIKNGLEEYISNNLLKDEIEKNYEDVKVLLSELDANIKVTVQNANKKKIVVTNKSLSFLEKYGLEVIVLDENTLDKTFEEVKKDIQDGNVKNIFTFEEDKISSNVDKFISSNSAKRTILYRLDSIDDDQRKNGDNYMSIMEENLELLKNEIYN